MPTFVYIFKTLYYEITAKIFYIFGGIMLLNSVMFFLGAMSGGMPIYAIIERFPKNKIMAILISILGYLIIKYLPTKSKKWKKLHLYYFT